MFFSQLKSFTMIFRFYRERAYLPILEKIAKSVVEGCNFLYNYFLDFRSKFSSISEYGEIFTSPRKLSRSFITSMWCLSLWDIRASKISVSTSIGSSKPPFEVHVQLLYVIFGYPFQHPLCLL